jgi:methanethiol S-methyltransferase
MDSTARSTAPPSRITARALILLTILFGAGSLVVLLAYLFFGSLGVIDLGLDETERLVFDGALCLLFFVQHSGMVRGSFRSLSRRFLRDEYFGAFFSIVSGVVLLAMILLWQESDKTLLTLQGAWRWPARALYFLSLYGFARGVRALGTFDTFGIRAVIRHVRGKEPPSVPFTVRGPYRRVRHPLYLFSLLLIWSQPDLTAERLLFNLLWTAWIVVGSILEERDLVAAFGDDYRAYRRDVPMLIPRLTRRRPD